MAKRKLVEVKVVIETTYLIPVYEDGNSINGRSIAEVIKEWFVKWPLSGFHAVRDGSKVSGSDKLLSTTIGAMHEF